MKPDRNLSKKKLEPKRELAENPSKLTATKPSDFPMLELVALAGEQAQIREGWEPLSSLLSQQMGVFADEGYASVDVERIRQEINLIPTCGEQARLLQLAQEVEARKNG
jgi:hypothetical protein